jgi:hypothetical protein
MTDYNKVLRSFIHFQEAAGFKLVSASDGEEWIKNPSTAEAADWVCGTDEGTLSFTKEGHRITAFAVLGNEAYCTIADAGWKKECPAKILKDFDDAWDAFSHKWEALEA